MIRRHLQGGYFLRRSVSLIVLAATLIGWTPRTSPAEESKLTFSGDLRGRFESFWFQEDASGARKEDRRRLRYRLRLDAKAHINEHAAVALRFSSNSDDSRSGNQTLGSPADFSPNDIVIRRAYLIYTPYANGKLANRDGHWAINFGRMPEPFTWKHGKDFMIWDNDYNLGGLNTVFDMAVADGATIFGTAGYYTVYENKNVRDPYFAGVQGGFTVDLVEKVKAGIRASYFSFDYLDNAFIMRGVDGTDGATDAGGNIVDGLTGDAAGGKLQVVETQGFISLKEWPVTLFGGFSSNLSAEKSMLYAHVDEEKIAYNVGIEGGNKKRYVTLGVAYYFIEANAFPSQYIDSDLFDGRTNRKGGIVYASRQLLEGAEFDIKVMFSDAIETGLPAFEHSVQNSKRTRLQADVIYTF